MKITKYPQSCLLIEKNNTRILIDPGNLVRPDFDVKDFGKVDAVLISHSHEDHFDLGMVEELAANGAKIYCNEEPGQKLGVEKVIIFDGEEFEIGEFKFKALDLPHVITFEQTPPQNTGYLIDGTFFHAGDGLKLDGLEAESCVVPIIGPSNSFVQAYNFIKSIGANKVIPMHFDGVYKADPNVFKERADDVNVIVLQNGESAEL